MLLYRAFGWECPRFAHLPLLLNPDRSKLSKRQGDVAVEDYRAKGYLPEALVNFVALLGWNPGDDREIFSLGELEREFSLERVGKSGAIFNLEKLAWMNGEHIRRKSDAGLLELVRPLLEEAGFSGVTDAYALDVIRLLKERAGRPADIVERGRFFFRDPETYDAQASAKHWKPGTAAQLAAVTDALGAMEAFAPADIESTVRRSAEALGVGAGTLIHPLRLALTGVGQGPGLFELMAVLGKETCLRRIAAARGALG